MHVAGVVSLFVVIGQVLLLRPLLALSLLVAIEFISRRVKSYLLWLSTIPRSLRLDLLLTNTLSNCGLQ